MENETKTNDTTPENLKQEQKQPEDMPLPDPTLLGLASGLAAQTMVSLGVFPNPATGESNIMLNQAKHLLDTVVMLDERTKAGQTPEESKTFANMLHEMRMIFMAAQQEFSRRSNEPRDDA